jgi:PAS domain S-box-containing protein
MLNGGRVAASPKKSSRKAVANRNAAALEQALRRRNDYLVALQETSLDLASQLDLNVLLQKILARAARLMDTTAGRLDLIEPGATHLMPKIALGALSASLDFSAQPGEGLTGRILQSGQPLAVDHYDAWPDRLKSFPDNLIGAVIGVPLLSDSKVLGVLTLAYEPTSRRTFSGEALEVLTQFARFATIAIQNARLFDAAQRDLEERKHAEEERQKAEVRYGELVESARAIVWRADARTLQTTFVSKQAEEMLGYPIERWVNEPGFWKDRIHPDDRDWVLGLTLQMIEKKRRHDFDYRLITADGQTAWVRQIVNVVVENGEPKEVVGITIDISERKRTEEALQDLSRRMIEAQEEERRRIARDLHDDVSQRIALLAIDLETLEQRCSLSKSPLVGALSDLKSRIHEVSADIHNLSRELHPNRLEDLGLTAAVKGLCQLTSKQKHIGIDFLHDEIPKSLHRDVALCLYRIVQEGLSNIVKHSGAKQAEVEICMTSANISLRITDAGAGFDVEAARLSGGLGLVSMQERLRALGGGITIQSRPAQGTRIEVKVPLRVALSQDFLSDLQTEHPDKDLRLAQARMSG